MTRKEYEKKLLQCERNKPKENRQHSLINILKATLKKRNAKFVENHLHLKPLQNYLVVSIVEAMQ